MPNKPIFTYIGPVLHLHNAFREGLTSIPIKYQTISFHSQKKKQKEKRECLYTLNLVKYALNLHLTLLGHILDW